MKNTIQPKPSKRDVMLTKAQAACDEFVEFLDNLFYEGYAERLATDSPQDFTDQLNQYLNNYNYV